jgi:hypothetical protein
MGSHDLYFDNQRKEIDMSLILPRTLLEWIDENRGEMSRQSFIIKSMFKLKEIADMHK